MKHKKTSPVRAARFRAALPVAEKQTKRQEAFGRDNKILCPNFCDTQIIVPSCKRWLQKRGRTFIIIQGKRIEDSGGEASYATGQGMVEGAVYTTGILELTDTGEYYLTIRMSLMDYTSNHSFWVQNVGDSGWSTPALGVTGNGTDGNGTTSDICIQVPSENCVVRGAMYVEPMGRDVIFFLYPSDFAAGNSTDMNATMVTETSGSSSSQTSDSAAAPSASSSSSLPSGNSQGSDSGETEESTGTEAEAEETQETQGAESEVQVLENTIEDPADTSQDTEEPSADETELNSAQGLSLSTAESSQEEEQTSAASSGTGAASQIMTLILAFTVSGLLLIGAAAGVVYYFRRNWRRWGGGEDDDE